MKGEMAWLFKKKITLPSPLMEKDWREIKWGDKEKELKALKSKVQELQLGSPDVQHLRILMYGPPGAGKSSFVNIDSIFQDRMTSAATVDAATDVSFTKMFQIHKIRKGKSGQLPFVICDVMGLETGDSGGVHPEDLMNTLKGHVKNGYKLNPRSPISDSDPHYNSCPSLGDRIHCLVGIVPADKVSLIDDDFFKKMREIRIKASELKIPEVAVLTKIDMACPEVHKDITLVYRSKKIKENMQIFSNKFGVPMTNIFPVKNYHEEGSLKLDLNVLMLSALINILNFANDHVGVMADSEDN
ncbi:interferon-induced protein 44-like isoform X1 [Alosa sapidissima]|uniref:interferon-induced protein 44-like isoform X1 n=1 Tax=Alosa sapidissima TaxID=34773 RepID=UPI001C098D74|nr:interferon-induced protein 44-like isoform X1 [Alosa sapidissima]